MEDLYSGIVYKAPKETNIFFVLLTHSWWIKDGDTLSAVFSLSYSCCVVFAALGLYVSQAAIADDMYKRPCITAATALFT